MNQQVYEKVVDVLINYQFNEKEVISSLVRKYPNIFLELVGKPVVSIEPPLPEGIEKYIGALIQDEGNRLHVVIACVVNYQLVEAIKNLRTIYNLSLKDAKEIVDNFLAYLQCTNQAERFPVGDAGERDVVSLNNENNLIYNKIRFLFEKNYK
jgi:ribosomal protein L7/L12